MVMEQLRHNGSFWQRVLCLVGAILVFSAPVMASVCPRGQCAPNEQKAAGGCHAMTPRNDAGSFEANSPLPCCQLTQNAPVTITPATGKVEVQPDASYVIAETRSMISPAIRRLSDSSEAVFSPPDVQSLLCILLV
jgi:hypothetical protein